VGLALMGSGAGPLQFEALLRDASTGIGPVSASPAHFAMATSVLSPFSRPEEEPFLLLQSTLSCAMRILTLSLVSRCAALRLSISMGGEEITLLDEEVLPATQQCLQLVDSIDLVLY
jgi:hypothetical protein